MTSLLYLLLAFAAAVVHAQSVSTCPDFHIIVARATNTTPPEGGMIKTSNAICAAPWYITHCTDANNESDY